MVTSLKKIHFRFLNPSDENKELILMECGHWKIINFQRHRTKSKRAKCNKCKKYLKLTPKSLIVSKTVN